MTSAAPSSSGSLASRAAVWWTQMTALALVVLELCWIIPWYRTLLEISYVAPVERIAVVMGLLMLSAFWLSKIFEHLRLVPVAQSIIMLVVFVVFLVFGGQQLLNRPLLMFVNGVLDLDPGAILVIMFFFWLWWRGSSLGSSVIRPVVVWRRFILGVILFLTHVFLVTRLRGMVDRDAPGLPLFTFFLVISLVGMVLSRITFVSQAYGVRKNPFDRRWLGSTLLTVVVVVSLALLLGAALSGQYSTVLDQAAEGVRWLGMAILFVASLPWLLLSYLISPLFPFLQQIMPTPTPVPIETPDPYYVPSARVPPPPPEIVPISEATQLFIFWGIILLLIATLIMAQRRARRGGAIDQSESESLLRPGEARRLFRKAVQEGLNAAAGLLDQFRMGKRLWAAARIRHLYAQLLDLCAELKRPRQPFVTPLEFLPVMGEIFPDHIASLSRITNAYDQVRYGELPENLDEVSELEAAYKDIHAEGQRLKKARMGDLQRANVDESRKIGM